LLITDGPCCEGASPDTDGEELRAALLRKLGGATPNGDGVTRVPIAADGEEPAR
jgi:hypothetical protein